MNQIKTLLLDIETAPNIADVWSLWNVNVNLNQLRQSSYTLCWAAKYLDEKTVFFGAEWMNKPGYDFLTTIYDLIGGADSVVTFNGDRFDIPTLNKDFLLNHLGPPPPYKSIDLYKTVKKQFRFPSNKLQYVATALEIGSKVPHEGHDLWVKVMAGDKKAQRDMKKYCIGDVFPLLEKLYYRVLPWIPGHPNGNLYSGTAVDTCGRCGYFLSPRGFAYTSVGKFQRYRCNSCGGWSRDTKRVEGSSVTSL